MFQLSATGCKWNITISYLIIWRALKRDNNNNKNTCLKKKKNQLSDKSKIQVKHDHHS